ncbi:HAD superfamily hydrolase (TIGR01509 family)/HAD superfamily hydrolase (TIGR01549 family) [Microcella putealis]|uniref:HAD superfamily hydrolase (TIGR01509 family)/HAD superfamily hydrolase (TIGR01549 family) n=1 Tax=Microcella putealis TaxID=337005 RepID=A0A4Q7LUT3_9MICO|nr:HAD family phosphatase [Microcella putealis]RZS58905.1 HAD superfamily hydrolase (TIGR01509 family)/HAD superfamily hydrolase (TIGR01549 family) [Microcella putealis]TQM23931.1 HAD superfamily hydrolase (TIGR01509 family)/HAD superfamily hydrolase (TIGR01549 family) [Microcella putealis]
MTTAPEPLDRPAAVLWDMDGTIVDTEPYWMRAEVRLVESFGRTWSTEDAMQLVGSGLENSAILLQRAGVELEVEQIIDRLTDEVIEQIETEVPWRPGARELIAALREAGIPIALVTMSLRRMAVRVADAIGDAVFDVVIAGDDVTEAKPHPEPYLAAARALGVDIHHCVAIEDSQFGLASAISSGAATIGVPLHLALHEGPTHTLWSTLEGRTVAELTAVVNAHLGFRAQEVTR